MSTVLMLSLAGSPGVTTSALAASLSWPQSVMLIEADTSRYSSILPGYFRGQVSHSRGLTELAVTRNNTGSLDINQVWGQTISLVDETPGAPDRRLLAGFKDPAAARAMDPVWGQLGSVAASFEGMGMDVIIDAGRWGIRDARSALLRLTDATVIVARPVLSDIVAVHTRLPLLRTELAVVGRDDSITLLLIEPSTGPKRSTSDIQKTLNVERVARIAWDDKTAAVFSQGEPSGKRFDKTPYGRTLAPAIEMIRDQLAEQRRRLDENQAIDTENER